MERSRPRSRPSARGPSRALGLALVLAAGLAAGCASAHNYLEPEGPLYAGGAGVPAAPHAGFRVVTFNIEYAERIDAAVAALQSPSLRGADVITLQEMDAPGAEAVAGRLGMNYVYYPASRHPHTGRDFGCAILSPWPMDESRKVLLPGKSYGIHQARAAVAATVRTPGGAVTVYSVHLTSPFGMGGGGRAHQADAIIADAEREPGPVVIAGDFNSGSVGKRFALHGYQWLTQNVGHSAGPFSFDHVFVRGLRLRDGASVGVDRSGPKASDHWPVWAVLVAEDATSFR